MNRSLSRKNGGQPQQVVVYEERGKGQISRGVHYRNGIVDDTGRISHHYVMANEKVKVNQKSASGRQTVNKMSCYYSPEDSSTYTEQHLVSRQANFTNYNGKPKQTLKTYNLYRTQYDSPEESWNISQSKSTVSNGKKTKVIERRRFDDNSGRSIDFYGNSSSGSSKAVSRSGNNSSKVVSRYGNSSHQDYEYGRDCVDSYLDDVFSSLSLR